MSYCPDCAQLQRELQEKTAALQQREERIEELESQLHVKETQRSAGVFLLDQLTGKLRAAEEQVKAKDVLLDLAEDTFERHLKNPFGAYHTAVLERGFAELKRKREEIREALKGEAK